MNDRGLIADLLSALEYHVEQTRPIHSTTLAIEVARAALAMRGEPVTWGVDWGKNGDQSCVSIIKKHADGTREVVAVEYGPTDPPSRKPQDDTDLLRQCLRLIESMSDSLDGEFGFGPSEPDPLVLALRERLGEQE